jgi:hypothetical protein
MREEGFDFGFGLDWEEVWEGEEGREADRVGRALSFAERERKRYRGMNQTQMPTRRGRNERSQEREVC